MIVNMDYWSTLAMVCFIKSRKFVFLLFSLLLKTLPALSSRHVKWGENFTSSNQVRFFWPGWHYLRIVLTSRFDTKLCPQNVHLRVKILRHSRQKYVLRTSSDSLYLPKQKLFSHTSHTIMDFWKFWQPLKDDLNPLVTKLKKMC